MSGKPKKIIQAVADSHHWIYDRTMNLKLIENPTDYTLVRTLFREYQRELNVNLCFQSFEEELAGLPGKYAPPTGFLLLAYWDGKPAGCGAFRSMEEQGCCEMKRLYVRPEYKGKGIGRSMAEKLLDKAREGKYKKMRLDTLRRLVPAIKLYSSMGFQEISSYYANPLEGVVYLEHSLID